MAGPLELIRINHRQRAMKQAPDARVSAAKLLRLSELRPTLAIVLGSGFGPILAGVEPDARIEFGKLPGFAPPGVSGHEGLVVVGRLGGAPVMVLSGRAHFYEGHSMSRVAFFVRALAAYGIRDLLLTNSAGGINPRFRAGDFMVLTDHINLMGANPLRPDSPERPCDALGRFADLSCVYDAGLRRQLLRAGARCGIKLRAGVYLAVSGPSYETPAEIRAFARLGADAVGMSTVPEAIVARERGMRVAGLSCITNLAAGRDSQPLTHSKVLAAAQGAAGSAAQLVKTFARSYFGIEKELRKAKLQADGGLDEA